MVDAIRRSGAGSRADRTVAAQPSHLSNVQILRGIAAVMVLVYHVGNELTDRGFSVTVPDSLGLGSAGVDLFFVISGFIMVHSTAAAFAKPGAPLMFLTRRLVRLAPLYWIVTTLAVLALASEASPAGVSAATLRWAAASAAFLFYPRGDGGDFPLYAQGWTLNFEMVFYLGFACALPFRRAVALPWLSLGFLALAVLGWFVTLPWPLTRLTDSNIVEFVLGVGLAEVHARGFRLSTPIALALAGLGALAFALTIGSVDAWLPARGFVWGPPALAVVASAALVRSHGDGPMRRGLEALGDASYALYLVHVGFFGLLAFALSRFTVVTAIPVPLYVGLCVVGAISAAFAVHRLVERPMTRGLNRSLGLSRRWRALTAGTPRAA